MIICTGLRSRWQRLTVAALLASFATSMLPATTATAAAERSAATLATPSQTDYQAEDATIYLGQVNSDHAGYTGTGFVNYDNVTGSYVEWTVSADQTGSTTIGIRYANGTTTNRPMDITVGGNISQRLDSLDSMQSGNILLILWRETGQGRYRKAADKIRERLDTYPRTSDGGWWHADSDSRQGQLWADGAYMVNPFVIRYGQLFNDAAWGNDESARQLEIYAKHLQRTSGAAAGLLYHAYDEPGGLTASWVHPEYGYTNGISWCRGVGWYGMATVDVLDLLPADHPARPALVSILRALVDAYARFQDPATGRWFQVVDGANDSRDWTETSCSAMYTFTISRAVQRGWVDAGYDDIASKGYQGVLANISIGTDGLTYLRDVCVGTSVSDSLSYYFDRTRATNDFHGLGAFLIMNEQMIRTGGG